MASAACPRSRATSLRSSASPPTRSATSTSTSPRCRTEEGKLRLFVAVDRTSKFAFARLVESAGKMEAAQFLRDLIEAVPYRIHTVLTDNGVQFTPRKQDIWDGRHIFDRVCDEHGIEHRLTKVNHPWTNGQVERMNRTIKDATVKRYHYDSHDQLRAHLAALRGRLQPRPPAQDPARPHALRVRLPSLDERARSVQARPVTPHPGTIHLVPWRISVLPSPNLGLVCQLAKNVKETHSHLDVALFRGQKGCFHRR